MRDGIDDISALDIQADDSRVLAELISHSSGNEARVSAGTDATSGKDSLPILGKSQEACLPLAAQA